MLITKEIEIDMGHRVPNHKSKCKNLHGHRYKIEVGVNDKVISTPGASDEGMVIDFGDLKQTMMDVLDAKYDHGLVLSIEDEFAQKVYDFGLKTHLVSFIPTAENLARHWYEEMRMALEEKKIKLAHVKIWETPTSTAIYTEEEFRADNFMGV